MKIALKSIGKMCKNILKIYGKMWCNVFEVWNEEDGRYDIICSGSLIGINYNEIESKSVGNLDDEIQEDIRVNKNFNAYKGAIYENIVADMLAKEGYSLFFYKNDKSTIKIDFIIRDSDSLIPIEVKSNNGTTTSLNNLINDNKYFDVKYGIKLGYKNIGFNGKFYTFPYFLTFLLKRFLKK